MFATFMVNPMAKYLAAALAAVLLLGGMYVKGRSDGKALTEAAVAEERHKWEIKVAETQSETDVRIANLANEYRSDLGRYQAEIDKLRSRSPETRVVERVVRVYVPQTADTTVPRGFVDLHNTAAAGRPLADSPAADAAQPSERRLSDVGTTVARNYYQCNATRAQLEALQAVVAEYQKQQRELTR